MAVKFTKPEINVREKLAELDKPSGIAGEAMLRANTPQEQNDLIGANLNNIIINGDFQVWQRGDTFTTGNKFTADRWYLYGNGTTNETVTRQTDVPKDSGNSYSLRITAGGAYTGGNYAMLRYKVEPKDLMKLNNAVGSTLQFWVKADNPGLYSITFLQHRTSGSQRQISKTYTINSSDVWEFKTVTIPADSTVLYDANTSQLSIDWVYGKNSNYSTGTFNDASWANNTSANRQPAGQTNGMSASGKKFSLSGVQFVPGKYPSGLPHLHRSHAEELALCQRYCYVIGDPNQVIYLGSGSMYTTTAVNLSVPLPVQLRHNSPSFTVESNSSSKWLNVYVGASGFQSNATPLQGDYTQSNLRIYIPGAHNGTNSFVGAGVWSMVLAGAKLIISAEL